ncbi:MAG: BrnT family toxin [Acidobacteriota bacterium]|nr:BrnT family toxin [Acidobacteriota bacterium]
MRYDFEWDTKKAKSNFGKHRISFERATTIFRDDEHSEAEERWFTMDLDANGAPLIISHTFKNISASVVKIRLISARKATKSETKQYEEGV